MELYEAIKKRQSDRKYENKPVPHDVIERVIEAARLAPSATNSQPWHFIVVEDPAKKVEVAKALTNPLLGKMNHFAANAPALIVVVEEPANASGKIGSFFLKKHLPHLDIGIVASHIALAATNEGLGSCIIGWVDEPKVRQILGIPGKRNVPLVITLGYSLEKEKGKTRKPLSDILSYNHYR